MRTNSKQSHTVIVAAQTVQLLYNNSVKVITEPYQYWLPKVNLAPEEEQV